MRIPPSRILVGLIHLGPILALAPPSPAWAEKPAPTLAFADGSIPPPPAELGRDLLGIALVLDQIAPEFTADNWRSQYDFLTAQLDVLATLLDDLQDAEPDSRAALLRSLAYGRDLASFTLSLMICERSRGAGSPLIRPNLTNNYGTGATPMQLQADLGASVYVRVITATARTPTP